MPQLSCTMFGRRLLAINDLDPVYVVLYQAQLPQSKLHRWLLAYWCFYHCGTASWIVDQPRYWQAMEQAAASKEYPRSPERRHFRGGQAAKSVAWLKRRGVEELFEPLLATSLTVANVMELVQQWRGFGLWISFKVADMLERLAITRVVFDTAAMFLFDSPRQGAALLHQLAAPELELEDVNGWAIDYILRRITAKAPPRYERPCNVQEAETILCKWKSYLGGHYHVGEDISSLKAGILKLPSKTGQQLLRAGVETKLWPTVQ